MVELGRCPVCGDRRRRRWLRHPRLRLWLCAGCGLGYSDPQPRAVVEQRYLSEYDLAAHFGAVEQRKQVLIERRLRTLPSPAPGCRLLDVGCADGQFAAAAMRRGWEAHGVELNPPAARRARERGVTVHEGRLEELAPAGTGYDVVTAWDVLEHVPDPGRFARRLVELTAPGGLIALATLNRRALVARAFRARWSMIVEDHYTYWDERSLRRAFDGEDVRPLGCASYGLGRDFVAWLDRLRRAAPVSGPGGDRGAGGAPSSRPWDTAPAILAAERALNRLLDALALGVELEIVLLRAAGPRASALAAAGRSRQPGRPAGARSPGAPRP